MKEFWERFFQFVEKVLPGLLMAFGLGHKVGSNEKEKLKRQAREKDLIIEKFNNKRRISKYLDSKSDKELIGSAIKRGEELLHDDGE